MLIRAKYRMLLDFSHSKLFQIFLGQAFFFFSGRVFVRHQKADKPSISLSVASG